MAIDEADQSDVGNSSDTDESDSASDERRSPEPARGSDVSVGEYTWADYMEEFGYGDEVSALYPHGTEGHDDQLGLDTDEETEPAVPRGDDWERVEFDPKDHLGYHPDELPRLISETFGANARTLREIFLEYVDPETTPVTKDVYTWEHYKWEYYYDEDGNRPRKKDGEIDRFDEEAALGFDPAALEEKLHRGGNAATELEEVVEERTVDVREDFDEDEFFSTVEGHTTVANRYDLEKAVPMAKKSHFREEERYWVNKPYAFVVIFHSEKENEKKYYLIEPYLTEIETELQSFLSGKLRTAIKYSEEGIKNKADEDGRREVIESETRRLLERYDLFENVRGEEKKGLIQSLRSLLDESESEEDEGSVGRLDGIEVRPEPVLLAEDSDTLNEYQVEKLLYLLKRNFIGYERIDGIKHDINVEDISVDGYNSPVFVYHSGYEQIISNVYHGEEELDDFVVKLAQRSGKGISKRLPQVDATLPDGSRAQLTLGREVSDHGTNYTIRQFKDVPFTPIDLINWNTFSLEEMAFLWLCIENHKSLIFAGGTASGKTTSLNAVSLFIPSNSKIVSIEDTREVELPQRNWIASVTRPSFSDDAQGDVDEFDLLEAALRQRPDYIVMGEIRGEEGRTLFQVMSTGHTTYTTFHADSVDEVLKRFTTDPINVSKTMFSALDLVSIQTQTRVQGKKVRRNKSLTEINHYEAENDEINVQDVYQWQAETDEYLKMGDSNTVDEIMFDRGWSQEKLQDELFKRQIIIAYLIKNELNTYAQVAATAQAFINDPDTILTLIANGQLEASLEDLREMESVLIDVDPEKEELVPRPDPTNETHNLSMDILERAEESLFEEYRGRVPSGLASALGEVDEPDPIEVDRADADEFDFGGGVDDTVEDDEWDLGDGSTEFTFDGDADSSASAPSWLDEEGEAKTEVDAASTTETAADSPGTSPENATDSASAGPETPGTPELESGSASATDERESPSNEASAVEAGASVPELEGETEPETESDDGTDEPELELTDPKSDSSSSASGSSRRSESNAVPTEPKEEGGLDGLFSDMEGTLDEVGEPVSVDEPVADDEVDTSNFDAMFPDRELGTIFGDGSPDAGGDGPSGDAATTGDRSDDSETGAATEPAPEKPEDDPGESETESAESDADAVEPAAESATESAQPEDETAGATDETEAPDTGGMEFGTKPVESDESRAATASSATDRTESETVDDPTNEESTDAAGEPTDDRSADTGEPADGNLVDDESTDEGAVGEEAVDDGAVENESIDEGSVADGESDESIFGEESGSIFGDDPDESDDASDDGDSPSCADGDDSEGGSIFGEESGSIFDDGEDEK